MAYDTATNGTARTRRGYGGDGESESARLCSAVEASYKALEFFRSRRRDRIALYAGGDYSEETSDIPRPVNLIALYVETFGRLLVGKNPRVMLSTFDRRQKPAVRAMQDWLNKQVERMDLASTLRRAVIDALFQVGVVKVALATPADAAASAWGLKTGDPYACCISLNDFVYDTQARDRDSMAFVGHRLRVPVDAANAFFKLRGDDKLQPTDKPQHNNSGDEAADTLSGWATVGAVESAADLAEVWEVYKPRQRQVCYYRSDDGVPAGEPLAELDWLGPARGPYHWIGFGWVPDSPMPKGKVGDLVDLDLDMNSSWRKLSRQAERFKQLTLVESSATDDGQAIRDASDGDIVPVARIGSTGETASRGPSPELLAFANLTRDLFDFFAGGLRSVGGLGASHKTASGEKSIHESANVGVADMQAEAAALTQGVMDALCWYHWNNPFKVMKTQYELPGLAHPIPRRLHPRGAVNPETGKPAGLRRDLPYEELDVRVDPYSIQHATPQDRSAMLKVLMTKIVAPMMGLLQQQGVQVDMNRFLTLLGEYEDNPDYATILNLVEPPDDLKARGGAGRDGAGMPAQTERTYTRQSLPQDTADTRRQEAMEMLAQAGAGRNGQQGR